MGPYATTRAISRINNQDGPSAAKRRFLGCVCERFGGEGPRSKTHPSSKHIYLRRTNRDLSFCETLTKLDYDCARLSDRMLSLAPELQASIMQYLALQTMKRIDNPTAASLRL